MFWKAMTHMFGFSSRAISSETDVIAGAIINATKRNELASERAREALRELLEINDKAPGVSGYEVKHNR